MEDVRTPEVLGELIDERASRLGDKIFLRFKDQDFSYRDMARFSNRCANAFKNLGVTKGDTVSIMLANCPQFIHVWFGLAKIGAVEVPVNTSYKGEFLRHIVDQSDSKILVIGSEFLDRLKLIEESLAKLRKVIVVGGLPREASKIPMIDFEEFFNAPEDPVGVEVLPSDALSIIYTSGTTGLSKGALAPTSSGLWLLKRCSSAAKAGRTISSLPSFRSITSMRSALQR